MGFSYGDRKDLSRAAQRLIRWASQTEEKKRLFLDTLLPVDVLDDLYPGTESSVVEAEEEVADLTLEAAGPTVDLIDSVGAAEVAVDNMAPKRKSLFCLYLLIEFFF